MDFTPHTEADVSRMLARLGLEDPSALFEHLPRQVLAEPLDLPGPLAEPAVMELVDHYAGRNRNGLVCFAGGGIYDHFLPPVVRSLTLRPEFLTSYTPYQPEVSQGVLQALFEYQSMVCAITGMDVANASLYDGATATIEAVNLAVAQTGRHSVWVSRGLHPHSRQVIATFAASRQIEVIEHPLVGGRTAWSEDAGPDPAALLVAQPNYLGVIEDYARPAAIAGRRGALAIAAVDPMTLGILRAPGSAGYDVAIAEGQPLGNPMSFGGPVVGIFASKLEHVRRLPGRLVGRTMDEDGRPAYVLTLQAREQHIRREKASSNICTNQTLNAVGAAVHLAWLGPGGLREVGEQSAQKAHYLAERLAQLPDLRLANQGPFVREFAVLLPVEPQQAVLRMADHGFLAGIPLSPDYPELPGGLLVSVTEKRTRSEMDRYVDAMKEVLADA
ncbi:MAG: aminomethyl-transferring glycine dehydrogenase subunit GcvPA [Actinomycetota bacterium]|nr:aminomethyl-transferring glycine dehydrogenase subunit GcvPA [Actinomycetota bacterium]